MSEGFSFFLCLTTCCLLSRVTKLIEILECKSVLMCVAMLFTRLLVCVCDKGKRDRVKKKTFKLKEYFTETTTTPQIIQQACQKVQTG